MDLITFINNFFDFDKNIFIDKKINEDNSYIFYDIHTYDYKNITFNNTINNNIRTISY
jgi:hypothetical protein